MSTEIIILLGVLAGIFQILGYVLYIKNSDIDPNPVTWFMFAYGTGILCLLEWDSSATWPELFLPVTCSFFSIYVSYRCWKKARARDSSRWWPEDWWPEDKWERLSFISDIGITLGYIAAWVLVTFSILTTEYKDIAVILFLLLSNLSVFPSFYPLVRETYLEPSKEAPVPWIVWTIAYTLLAIVTYETHHSFFHILMFYPLINILLHGIVAWISSKKVRTFA